MTLLLAILSCLAAAQSTFDACTNLMTTLSLENTTILIAERLTEGQTISPPASCQLSEIIVSTNACRIYAVVNTTAESAVHFEMWLPDVWFGRFLAVGNGGLAGCKFVPHCAQTTVTQDILLYKALTITTWTMETRFILPR